MRMTIELCAATSTARRWIRCRYLKGGERLKLKEIREEKGVTISALAQKSGITRQTIYRLENEMESTANSKTLVALADALGVRVTDFFAD